MVITCDTPLGKAIIEWKSWKEYPSYDLEIDGKWIACEYSLEEIKEKAVNYIMSLADKLAVFLWEQEGIEL